MPIPNPSDNPFATKSDVEEIVSRHIDNLAQMLHLQFAHIDDRFEKVEGSLDKVEQRLGVVEGRVGKIEATMVTKDYLDDKLADLKGELVIMNKKEDKKIDAVIDTLQKKKVIDQKEASALHILSPFPKM